MNDLLENDFGQKETVALGGGCFWCTEAVFKMLKGIISVKPGYAGGDKENPLYEDVYTGATGHAEVIKIEYNPKIISFEDLLAVFFATHDATTLNQQGEDVGTQYRSIILFNTEEQKKKTKKFIENINKSGVKGKPIVTQVKPLTAFYMAEKKNKDFFRNNPKATYCQVVINPKLEKVKQKFAELLKKNG